MQATAEKIKTMKAIRQTAFGGPDVLRYEDSPMPALQSGEVLIRVRAVGLNPPTGTCVRATRRCPRSGARRWIFR